MTLSLNTNDLAAPPSIDGIALKSASALNDRAQSSRLSATFDQTLRKKSTLAEERDAPREPLNDKSRESDRADEQATTEAVESSNDALTTDAAPTHGDDTPTANSVRDDPNAEVQVPVSHPADAGSRQESAPPVPQAVEIDARPITIRSLNKLILSGERRIGSRASPPPNQSNGSSSTPSTLNAARSPRHFRGSNPDNAETINSHDTFSADDHRAVNAAPQENSASALSDASRQGNSVAKADAPDTIIDPTPSAPQPSTAPSSAVIQPNKPAERFSTITTSSPSSQTPRPVESSSNTNGANPGASRHPGQSPGDPLSKLLSPTKPATSSNSRPDSAFTAQLLRGVSAAVKQQTGSVTIRLNPESLGRIKISIDLPRQSDSSVVSARFEASSEAARKLLEQSLPQLREALTQRGLEVDRLEASFAPSPADHPLRALIGTRNAEGTPDAPPSNPSSHAQVSPDGGGNTDERGHDGQESAHHLGTEAQAPTDDELLSALARSVTGGQRMPGRSAGIYQLRTDDGGAARLVVDALA